MNGRPTPQEPGDPRQGKATRPGRESSNTPVITRLIQRLSTPRPLHRKRPGHRRTHRRPDSSRSRTRATTSWSVGPMSPSNRSKVCFPESRPGRQANEMIHHMTVVNNEDAARTLVTTWHDERARARTARIEGDADAERRHLERAHILSQPLVMLHLRSHVAMLAAALRHRDHHEITAQLFRLLVAAPGTVTGRYPVGNTGGGDVSATLPMPIPADLAPIIHNAIQVMESR
jgi:hypothetical protein